MTRQEAIARELAYQDGVTFDKCHKPAKRRYERFAEAVLDTIARCDSCGRETWESCKRVDTYPCLREHLGGTRSGFVR